MLKRSFRRYFPARSRKPRVGVTHRSPYSTNVLGFRFVDPMLTYSWHRLNPGLEVSARPERAQKRLMSAEAA